MNQLHIGFSGTRDGMTEDQVQQFGLFLEIALVTSMQFDCVQPPVVLHHGDCVGSDEQADAIAKQLRILRVAHPGPDGPLRAHCDAERVLASLPYLERNHVIVKSSRFVVCTPKEYEEQMRSSGTWATKRYARKANKRALIIYPNGLYEWAQ